MKKEESTPTTHRFGTGLLAATLVLFLAMSVGEMPSRVDDRGKATFIEKGCANCHAVYGRPVGNVEPRGGPDLGERKIYGTYLELAAMMWNHFPDMERRMRRTGIEMPQFTEEEVHQIVSYLSYIRYMGEPGSQRAGRKLLKDKGCQTCHTFGGVGGDIGSDFTLNEEYMSPLAFAASMWNHGPEMEDLFEEHNVRRPEFSGHQIVDIVAGVQSYMAPTFAPAGSFEPGDDGNGRILVQEKGCLHCHAVDGFGGTTADDFADISFDYSVTEIAANMWNHGPLMWEAMEEEGVSFPTFQRDEMADVIAYLYQLRLQDAPGDPDKGANAVREKNCLTCHPVRGEGDGAATDLAKLEGVRQPLAMMSRMWNHAADMEEEFREKGLRWPQLTGREMADLHAYLQRISLRDDG